MAGLQGRTVASSYARTGTLLAAQTATQRVERVSAERVGAAWLMWLALAWAMFLSGSQAFAQSAPPVVSVAGPQGGPFPTSPVSVNLSNPHSAPIQWAVSQDPEWLSFSRRRGILQPGAGGQLTATVDQSNAATLSPGVYDARVQYRHPTTQQRVTMVIFRLTVSAANYSLVVTPGNAYTAQGPVGGPFTPATQSYTLQNTGNVPFDWTASGNTPWIFAQAPSSGVLAPGASTSVVVALNQTVAGALPVGLHVGAFVVRRTSTAALVDYRPVRLDVQAPNTGWTDFTPSADTRVVYVSTSGNDANNGLSPNTPKRTISAGKALIRHGFPDWLLLKRGDVFDSPIGQWITSGRSASEPQLIGAYGAGTQRPLLRTGNQSGIHIMGSSSSAPQINHIAIVGLEMWAHTYNGTGAPYGLFWVLESNGLLVEDCYIRGYQINISIPGMGGRKRDVKIRRNVLADAFATTGSVGHAIYMENCDNLLIEENVLDRNGWNPSVPGAVPSIFRHGIYIQAGAGACTGVVVRRNIISNSSSHGLQLRSGGVAEDNLFLRNSIALTLGGGHDPSAGGVNIVAKGNVVLDGKNIDAANPRGWGIDASNVSSGTIAYNIVANQGTGTFPIPMGIGPAASGFGVFNTVIERNIISGWGGPMMINGNSSQISNVLLRNNDFNQNVSTSHIIDHMQSSNTGGLDSVGNRFRSLAASNAWMRVGSANHSLAGWGSLVGDVGSTALPTNPYPDAGRSIASYHQSIGGTPSHDAFMAQARLQSRAYWRSQYTASAAIAYIRAGFGLVVP